MAHDLEFPGLARSTNEVYLKHVNQFVAHFARSADQLGRKHACSWLFWLRRTRQLSPATVNVAIAALSQLFASLNRPEVMAGIHPVREHRSAPDVLSASEVQLLLAAATTAKHRAMFSLLYCAGLRVSELLALRVRDIDKKRMTIRIRGAGARARIVPLSPHMLTVLREQLRSRRRYEQWLFAGRAPKTQMTRVGVSEAMRNCARAAGITKRVHPHLLRRSFAAHLLELGTDLRTIQALLDIGPVGARHVQSNTTLAGTYRDLSRVGSGSRSFR